MIFSLDFLFDFDVSIFDVSTASEGCLKTELCRSRERDGFLLLSVSLTAAASSIRFGLRDAVVEGSEICPKIIGFYKVVVALR